MVLHSLFNVPFRTVPEWINPAQYNLVVVTSSEGRNLPYGKLEDIISRESAALNCHTNDDKYVSVNLSQDTNILLKLFCMQFEWKY